MHLLTIAELGVGGSHLHNVIVERRIFDIEVSTRKVIVTESREGNATTHGKGVLNTCREDICISTFDVEIIAIDGEDRGLTRGWILDGTIIDTAEVERAIVTMAKERLGTNVLTIGKRQGYVQAC